VREECAVPGAAFPAHAVSEGMPLSVVAFRNEAPLHGVAVERPAGVQGLGVAPTGRAMVNNEIVAVGSAEALAHHRRQQRYSRRTDGPTLLQIAHPTRCTCQHPWLHS